MVTKKSGSNPSSKKSGAKKASKLRLNKETVRNLSSGSKKGGKKGKKAACGCGASFTIGSPNITCD